MIKEGREKKLAIIIMIIIGDKENKITSLFCCCWKWLFIYHFWFCFHAKDILDIDGVQKQTKKQIEYRWLQTLFIFHSFLEQHFFRNKNNRNNKKHSIFWLENHQWWCYIVYEQENHFNSLLQKKSLYCCQ